MAEQAKKIRFLLATYYSFPIRDEERAVFNGAEVAQSAASSLGSSRIRRSRTLRLQSCHSSVLSPVLDMQSTTLPVGLSGLVMTARTACTHPRRAPRVHRVFQALIITPLLAVLCSVALLYISVPLVQRNSQPLRAGVLGMLTQHSAIIQSSGICSMIFGYHSAYVKTAVRSGSERRLLRLASGKCSLALPGRLTTI